MPQMPPIFPLLPGHTNIESDQQTSLQRWVRKLKPWEINHPLLEDIAIEIQHIPIQVTLKFDVLIF